MESPAPTTSPASPAATLASVPDPRRQASVVYPLPAILALAVTAILCAHTSVLARAEWCSRQPAARLCRLGFPEGKVPCQSTLHRLFRKLDARALAAALHVACDEPNERERGSRAWRWTARPSMAVTPAPPMIGWSRCSPPLPTTTT